MKIEYEEWLPNRDSLATLTRADAICEEYAAEGYDLTLRQLYYQFVARGWIPNSHQSYKRLGSIINKGRLGGFIDWDHIVDRTRKIAGHSHWTGPGQIIKSSARSFRLDLWADQPTRVEVWVEKEALAGVVQRVANLWDVDYFSCRGYVSQSELWRAVERLDGYLEDDQDVVILHLGDHDPSGIDMTRDIADRIEVFRTGNGSLDWGTVEVRRIALNADQISEFNPPPNPAKLTDSRASAYVAEFGYQSWELDALDPRELHRLIEDHITGIIDIDRYNARYQEQRRIKSGLSALSRTEWAEIEAWVTGRSDEE